MNHRALIIIIIIIIIIIKFLSPGFILVDDLKNSLKVFNIVFISHTAVYYIKIVALPQ